MATQSDFRVKNGLIVGDGATIDGNVGIGTTPTTKLDVEGKTVISSDATNPLTLYKYGSGAPTIIMFAAIVSTNVVVSATGASTNSTTYKIMKTLI
tara:strand:- start:60 stop:347 length:288 start_codon:yes stop_codon:yes gene_type:complete